MHRAAAVQRLTLERLQHQAQVAAGKNPTGYVNLVNGVVYGVRLKADTPQLVLAVMGTKLNECAETSHASTLGDIITACAVFEAQIAERFNIPPKDVGLRLIATALGQKVLNPVARFVCPFKAMHKEAVDVIGAEWDNTDWDALAEHMGVAPLTEEKRKALTSTFVVGKTAFYPKVWVGVEIESLPFQLKWLRYMLLHFFMQTKVKSLNISTVLELKTRLILEEEMLLTLSRLESQVNDGHPFVRPETWNEVKLAIEQCRGRLQDDRTHQDVTTGDLKQIENKIQLVLVMADRLQAEKQREINLAKQLEKEKEKAEKAEAEARLALEIKKKEFEVRQSVAEQALTELAASAHASELKALESKLAEAAAVRKEKERQVSRVYSILRSIISTE